MTRFATILALAAPLALAGCGEPAPTAPVAPKADGWIGQWRGVEGLNLTIQPNGASGRYLLIMQYGTDASDSGTFAGTAEGDGIVFTRPADGAQRLTASDGAGTGLKWLEGKKDCLAVKPGEGYCRD